MGTRFLMTRDSPVPDRSKSEYVRAGTGDIVVSTKIDGIPQRMILTPAMKRIELGDQLGIAVWRQQQGVDHGERQHPDRDRRAPLRRRFEDMSGIVDRLDGDEGDRVAGQHGRISAIAVEQPAGIDA